MRTGRCPRCLWVGFSPNPPLHPPSIPTLTSNLMACSSGFSGARSVLGGWGGGRKRKPGSVKPAAPSPQALRFPVTHPWGPRTTYSGRRHRCFSGSCPSHCWGPSRVVSQAPPVSSAQHKVGQGLRGLVRPPSLPVSAPGQCPPGGCQGPLTLFSTTLSPSWKDSARRHTEVRCWPRMVTWEPLRRRAGWWA